MGDNAQGQQEKTGAIVLMSGGLDSLVAAALTAERFREESWGGDFELVPLFIDYGQVCAMEERAFMQASVAHLRSKLTYARVDVTEPLYVKLSGSLFGNTKLTSTGDVDERTPTGAVTSAYVPLRNAIFLSMAAAAAEARDIGSVIVGTNYNEVMTPMVPDGTERFLKAMELALDVGSVAGMHGRAIQIVSPLAQLSKVAVVSTAWRLGLNIRVTRSCYRKGPGICHACPACHMRSASIVAALNTR